MPPVSRTTADASADADFNALTVARAASAGIYGPGDPQAHDHTDWVGSGGVPAPDASGNFVITAAGSLVLTLASSYDQRLAEIVPMTAPAGAPTGYWYRRANLYYPAWGDNEARYCWLGWERLLLPLAPPVPCTLTVSITYRQYTFSDNHLSDSTRQTDFGSSYVEQTVTYSLPVEPLDHPFGWSGTDDWPVTLIAPLEGDYPLLERVVSIEVAFPAEAVSGTAWRLAEPRLARASAGESPQATRLNVKTFEGVDPTTTPY